MVKLAAASLQSMREWLDVTRLTGFFIAPPLEAFVATKSSLRGARFGMPWKKVWESAAAPEKSLEYRALMDAVDRIKAAGALVLDVDFPSADEIMSPDGWDWYNSPSKVLMAYRRLKDGLLTIFE